MTKPIKVFSAFTGIGAFEKAFMNSDIPFDLVGFSEIDKFAIQTFTKNFPGHENFGDITKIDPGKLPDFDVFVGGFPCQAFSVAGHRKGFEDTRGTLFFDCARILNAKMPPYAIFENVKGLTTHDNGKTLQIIVETLRSLGYAVDFQILNSKDFGVAQNRERIFIVCIREDLCGTIPDFWHFYFAQKTDDTKRIVHFLEPEEDIDEKFYLRGDQIKKQIDLEELIRLHRFNQLPEDRFILSESRTEEAKKARADHRKKTGNDFSPRGEKKLSPRFDGICGTITATQSITDGNLVLCFALRGRGLAGEIEQKFEPRFDGLTNTLTSVQKDNLILTVGKEILIRRLTPKECERLQGFPDDWTKKGYENKIDLEIFLSKEVCVNAGLKDADEKLLFDQKNYASSITRDGKNGEIQVSLTRKKEKMLGSVNCVIEMLTAEDSVCDIISHGNDMVILCDQKRTSKIGIEEKKSLMYERMGKNYTGQLLKITLDENLKKKKWSTISILIKEIMRSKIFFCAKTGKNITDAIIIWKKLEQNYTNGELLDLKMGNIISISDSQRYRQTGNSITVSVIEPILKELFLNL